MDIKESYRQMLRIRLFEESLIPLINDGTIKTPCHLCNGQEAVAVGVCSALRPQDHVYSHHRSHGHYLAKGGDMKRLCAEIYGKKDGCCHGRAGSMHIMDPDVGFMGVSAMIAGSVSLAVGDAMTTKLRKEDRVTVAFFGDGAMGEGIVYEAINLAVLYELPIIFVCENNGYSAHMPIKKCAANVDLSDQISGFGIHRDTIYGNDVNTVNNYAEDVIDRKALPYFLECKTYRLCGHVGPDDKIMGEHTDIRPKEEVEAWKKQDPIKQLHKAYHDYDNYACMHGEEQLCELMMIEVQVKQEIAEAHEFARDSEWPVYLEKYVYA